MRSYLFPALIAIFLGCAAPFTGSSTGAGGSATTSTSSSTDAGQDITEDAPCVPCPAGPRVLEACLDEENVCRIVTCEPGWANCTGSAAEGCDINIRTDQQNCGGCGMECSQQPQPPHISGLVCVAGACALYGCLAPWLDCNGMPGDGCETDASISPDNCGRCGTCPADPHCTMYGVSPICMLESGVQLCKCQTPAHCTDKLRDAEETDVDCGGGGLCGACGPGRKCFDGNDCMSGTCTAGFCQ